MACFCCIHLTPIRFNTSIEVLQLSKLVFVRHLAVARCGASLCSVSVEFRWRCFCPAHAKWHLTSTAKNARLQRNERRNRFNCSTIWSFRRYSGRFSCSRCIRVCLCGHTVGLSLCRGSHLLFIRFLDQIRFFEIKRSSNRFRKNTGCK